MLLSYYINHQIAKSNKITKNQMNAKCLKYLLIYSILTLFTFKVLKIVFILLKINKKN